MLFCEYAASTLAPTAPETCVLLFAEMATRMLRAASAYWVLDFELTAAAIDSGFVVSTPSCTDMLLGLKAISGCTSDLQQTGQPCLAKCEGNCQLVLICCGIRQKAT